MNDFKLVDSVLIVREGDILGKAVAQELGGMDDKDLTESFLQQMSVDYQAPKQKNRTKVIEDPADEGSNKLVPDGQDSIL